MYGAVFVTRADADEDAARAGASSRRRPSWLLANAIGKVSAIPMTSPVERISGPRTMSTPANLRNGNTLSLTDTCEGSGLCGQTKFGQFCTGHDFGGNVGDGNAGGFGNKGNGAAGARVDFKDVDVDLVVFFFDRELDIHQTDDVQVLAIEIVAARISSSVSVPASTVELSKRNRRE